MLDAHLDAIFEKFVRTFTLDTHPTTALLKSLLLDESERTDAEVSQCLEFIYAHIVNKFQGDLAEAYAVEVCTELVREEKGHGRLPAAVTYVWDHILEKGHDPRSQGEDEGWRKGADGLLVEEVRGSESDHTAKLLILGVVEVKSYALSYRRASVQIERHLSRLRHGLRIGDRHWRPESLFFSHYDDIAKSWVQTSVLEEKSAQVLRLLIKPTPAKASTRSRPSPALPPLAREIILPYPKSKFAADAYLMTTWFIERLGAEVFTSHPNPWPEMTAEEAGSNALQEALYHIGLRPLPKRQRRIATRLYNVYGFGYESSENHKGMMWPVRGDLVSDGKTPEPTAIVPPDMKLDEIMDTAWTSFRQNLMAEAMAHSQTAMAMGPDEKQGRRLHWLQGMIHYYRAEFAEAVRVLPQPVVETPDDWWLRDKLTLARIFARLDRLPEASLLITEVAAAGRKGLFLTIAIPACEAMVMMKRGQIAGAEERLHSALAELKRLYAIVDDRRQKGLGHLSYYNPSAVHEAAFDIVAGLTMTGELKTAMEVLSVLDDDIFSPNLLLLEKDPALEPLRVSGAYGRIFSDWLAERKRRI